MSNEAADPYLRIRKWQKAKRLWVMLATQSQEAWLDGCVEALGVGFRLCTHSRPTMMNVASDLFTINWTMTAHLLPEGFVCDQPGAIAYGPMPACPFGCPKRIGHPEPCS